MKRPASCDLSTYDASVYTKLVKVYDTLGLALQDLGSGTRCREHCARAVKKVGRVTFMRCRLRQSVPPCKWAGILKEASDGSTSFMQHPSLSGGHNTETALAGKRVSERGALLSKLTATATSRPRAALRSARLDKTRRVQKAKLRQVQELKRALIKERFGNRKLGQIRVQGLGLDERYRN